MFYVEFQLSFLVTISGNGCAKRLALQLPAISPVDLLPRVPDFKKTAACRRRERQSRFGPAVRLVSRKTSVRFHFGSPLAFSPKVLWFVDTVCDFAPHS